MSEEKTEEKALVSVKSKPGCFRQSQC